MKQLRTIILLLAALAALTSCEWITNMIHDEEVIARIGDHKLYRSELAGFIPRDATPEDSTTLAA